jgi:branched-chain amino acid aminotransferase
MQITINPNPNPVADAERVARVAQPGFGKYFTDNMFIAEWNEEKGWHDARLTAYAPLTLDPATMVFHYGQEIFAVSYTHLTLPTKLL